MTIKDLMSSNLLTPGQKDILGEILTNYPNQERGFNDVLEFFNLQQLEEHFQKNKDDVTDLGKRNSFSETKGRTFIDVTKSNVEILGSGIRFTHSKGCYGNGNPDDEKFLYIGEKDVTCINYPAANPNRFKIKEGKLIHEPDSSQERNL